MAAPPPLTASFYKVQDGAELDPDEYLSHYDDWHDASTWPVSSRQSEVMQHSIAQQADPLTKPGVVGAFCRAYTVEATNPMPFLSEVPRHCDRPSHYNYGVRRFYIPGVSGLYDFHACIRATAPQKLGLRSAAECF